MARQKRSTTFWDVIENTLVAAGSPLSAEEIWQKATDLGTIGDFVTTGKTPPATIAAYCYTNINNKGNQSLVVQVSKNPTRFDLRSRLAGTPVNSQMSIQDTSYLSNDNGNQGDTTSSGPKYFEKDLHAILVSYAYAATHFKAHLKTLNHSRSSKTVKGKNEWLHPDLVGVYFPFHILSKETILVQSYMSNSSIKLFSFELKLSLDYGNLRQSYFQAVSNSSWANEGYLVAADISEDQEFRDEIRRLNNAFGIGILKLNTINVHESEILFPSRINPEIDWDTVNRLAEENSDFKDFLTSMADDCQVKKVLSKYDEVLLDVALENYQRSKNMI